MQTARQTVSIVNTEALAEQIKTVREHFGNAVTVHRVLARATELGMRLLSSEPEKLSKEPA